MKSILTGILIVVVIALFAVGFISRQDFTADEVYQTDSELLNADK